MYRLRRYHQLTIIRAQMKSRLRWGIDLGGTKIEGVVLHADEPSKIVARERLSTEQEEGYEHILSRIKLLLSSLEERVGAAPERIGMGTPGVLDPCSETLKNSNTQCLIGKPLQRDIERLTGYSFRLANDANCFALAEATGGAARGADVVFGVILGTGVGGGVVVKGEVLSGAQGIAGEWGHNVLDATGKPCYCGKRGCVEQWCSGPALEAYYAELAGTPRRLSEIEQRASTDPHAQATLDRLVTKFGQAIATVINILDPDIVVLGGGVSNVRQLYAGWKASAVPFVFNDRIETRVVQNGLGDSAGVIGAAMLWG